VRIPRDVDQRSNQQAIQNGSPIVKTAPLPAGAQLAEGLIVQMVERYLAEYRPILREHGECHQALMNILDVFVRVGWPSAHRPPDPAQATTYPPQLLQRPVSECNHRTLERGYRVLLLL
jgi:hypothetical protein